MEILLVKFHRYVPLRFVLVFPLKIKFRQKECSKVRRIAGDADRKVTQVIKLHRTTLRLIEVAASRPILRILNPHIYSDLGGLGKRGCN